MQMKHAYEERFNINKDCPLLANITWDGKRFKWQSDFQSLKKLFKQSIGLKGKQSSPGGGSKKIKANGQIQVIWYYRKQLTLLRQDMLFHSLIISLFLFGIEVWGVVYKKYLSQIDRLFKRDTQ